jgi:phage portal protein BeeE
MFGVRNPTTDIRSNGYGRGELEDMILVVTALLNTNQYNANFFKVGSAPRGILKYSGNINHNTVEEFRKQWMAQVTGVQNAHKIPMINADKLDFINTHIPNKDMEWSRFQEFLIKINCAMYSIDPSEIGFPMSGSSDSKPMFEGNNEARLKYSRDKGLKPLLKYAESWVNKWIVSQLDPNYVFRFVGIEDEKNELDDLDADIKRLSNFMTLNEIREKYNLPPVKGGDIVLNSVYNQALNQQAQMDLQKQQMSMGGGDQDMSQEDDGEDNPFYKSLMDELPQILGKEL